MKHFSEAEWVDFARNLALPTKKMAMQQHIDEGCQKCSATLRIWQGLGSVSQAERASTPPEDTVRIVTSQFAALKPDSATGGVRLIFDSLLQPLTAGTRGSVAARQFLYETDDYYIDLRLEPRTPDDRAFLTGQVLNQHGADRHAPGLAVRLQEGAQPLAHTSTNEFGEFQLEFAARHSLSLFISGGIAREIVLPLYGIYRNPLPNKDLD